MNGRFGEGRGRNTVLAGVAAQTRPPPPTPQGTAGLAMFHAIALCAAVRISPKRLCWDDGSRSMKLTRGNRSFLILQCLRASSTFHKSFTQSQTQMHTHVQTGTHPQTHRQKHRHTQKKHTHTRARKRNSHKKRNTHTQKRNKHTHTQTPLELKTSKPPTIVHWKPQAQPGMVLDKVISSGCWISSMLWLNRGDRFHHH